MLLSWVLRGGGYQLDSLWLLEGPEAIGHCQGIPENTDFLVKGYIRKSLKRVFAMDQQYPQVLPTGTSYSWEHSVESPGRGRPGTLLLWCCSCKVSRIFLQVVKEPNQYKVQSQPSNLCKVHFSNWCSCVLSFPLLFLLSILSNHFALWSWLQILHLQMPTWGISLL